MYILVEHQLETSLATSKGALDMSRADQLVPIVNLLFHRLMTSLLDEVKGFKCLELHSSSYIEDTERIRARFKQVCTWNRNESQYFIPFTDYLHLKDQGLEHS